MATTNVRPQADLPDFEEGQVINDGADMSTLAVLNRAEVDQQITTAKRYPRSLKQFRDEALQMVTLTEEIAGECIYALPRDGKTIEGPSARFAEVILSAWGNARAGARVVSEEGEFVTAQGAFYDLQRNVAISYEVKRRIVDKHGNRYKPDMIGVTANAASSIALRNAICKGIPKAFWKSIYDAARATVAGDFKTLANRRADALKQLQVFGVTPEMVYRLLNVQGVEDIGIEHLVTLKGLLTSIREGDTSVEEVFGSQQGSKTSRAATNGTAKATEDLADRYGVKQKNAQPTEAASAQPDPPQASEPTTQASAPISSPTPSEEPAELASPPLNFDRPRGRGGR